MVSSAELIQGWFSSNTGVNKVNDRSAEQLEDVNGSMISLSNPVKHESQPVTSTSLMSVVVGSWRELRKGWTCPLT